MLREVIELEQERSNGTWKLKTCQASNHVVATCPICGSYWICNQGNFRRWKRFLKSNDEKFQDFIDTHVCIQDGN